MLDIFLARPHDLHGTVDVLGDLDGAGDAVHLQPPAEAAADQVIVDDDLVERQAGGLGRGRLGPRDRLGADPDFAAVPADMDRAVHRLHRRVREERNLVGRLDLGGGARHRAVGIADVLRNGPRPERRLLELGRDRFGAEPGVRPVVPFDHQGREALLRGAHVVGHHGDGVVEPHDLAHALDGLGRGIVHALHAAAEHRRLRKRRDLHAGRPDVDAVDGRSVDLRRRVQTLGRGADQLEILRSLERDAFGDRHAGRIGGKLAVAEASPRRRVNHLTALRAAGRRIDIPALRRRRHEHGPRGRTGLAQRLPCPADRVRVAGRLHAQQRDWRRAFRWAGRAPACTCCRSTSSSSAISIGMEV